MMRRRALLAAGLAAPLAHKWALVVRDPLPRWTAGNVALLDDAWTAPLAVAA